MEWTGEGIVRTRRYTDKGGAEKVAFDLEFLGGKTGISVPEEIVPNVIENCMVRLLGRIGFSRTGPYFRVERITKL